ncbi:MAG TPA: hypothetical protein VFF68_06670, partial [Anaerolineaceae bacterium]|nr:hypothetical protein [Anaerolineaceae bacterium]
DPAGEYAAGASVSLTAEPNPDYTFQHWLVNGVPVAANPLSIAINENSMVVAIFTAQFTLAYDSNPSNGTITGSAPGTYEDGATIVLNAVPDEGYLLDKWMVNGVEHTANPLTFPLLANTTVSAGFVEAPEMVYLPLVLR